MCLVCRWKACKGEPVCCSPSRIGGIMMRRDPVMKSEATPHYLELQFVHDRPSFLYSAASLMSSFFISCLVHVMSSFFLGRNWRCMFLYMQAGEHRHEEVQRQKASLRGGENRQILARLCTYYEMRSGLAVNFELFTWQIE